MTLFTSISKQVAYSTCTLYMYMCMYNQYCNILKRVNNAAWLFRKWLYRAQDAAIKGLRVPGTTNGLLIREWVFGVSLIVTGEQSLLNHSGKTWLLPSPLFIFPLFLSLSFFLSASSTKTVLKIMSPKYRVHLQFALCTCSNNLACVDAFSLQLRSFNTSVSGSTTDMYFEFKDKNAGHQALQYMRNKPLIDWQIRNQWQLRQQANLNLDSKMGCGSAAQTTEWMIK